MSADKDGRVSRRSFLDILLGGSIAAIAAGILYPLFRFFTPPPVQEEAVVTSVNLGPADDLPVNSGKIFRFGNEPGIIIRDSRGEFHAFTATCTHLSCIVQYDPKADDIWCACHNGRYDLNGINISGPPPRPLTPFVVNVLPDSREIVITTAGGGRV